jgi:hypothetical protein
MRMRMTIRWKFGGKKRKEKKEKKRGEKRHNGMI